jgi:hypothetical protein
MLHLHTIPTLVVAILTLWLVVWLYVTAPVSQRLFAEAPAGQMAAFHVHHGHAGLAPIRQPSR